MNHTNKTYGVIINLDYFHQPAQECKNIWNKIIQNMKVEGFCFDKRMFVMTTTQNKDYVCRKARIALNNIDKNNELYNQITFDYITDFFTVDMTDYVDLRLPPPEIGVILNESSLNNTQYVN